MDKRFAIFDMDGTLVDSMPFWQNLAEEYLHSKGIAKVAPAILEQIKPMTMTQSAALFVREYELSGTPETIAAEMNRNMEEHYKQDVPLKPGAQQYLQKLRQNGVRMCVASATAEPLMQACLARLDVLECFDFLLSCEGVGAGKTQPDVYHAAAKKLGAVPEEIAVYEDAYYAGKTAKNAGYHLVAVYDGCAGDCWNEMRQLADEVICSWEEGEFI